MGNVFTRKYKNIEKLKRKEKYYGTYKRYKPSYLGETRNILKWYINPYYQHKCKYNNSRIHSINLRGFYNFGKMIYGLKTILILSEWKKFPKKYAKTADFFRVLLLIVKTMQSILDLIYKSKPIFH